MVKAVVTSWHTQLHVMHYLGSLEKTFPCSRNTKDIVSGRMDENTRDHKHKIPL